jgi:hypothetical protein
MTSFTVEKPASLTIYLFWPPSTRGVMTLLLRRDVSSSAVVSIHILFVSVCAHSCREASQYDKLHYGLIRGLLTTQESRDRSQDVAPHSWIVYVDRQSPTCNLITKHGEAQVGRRGKLQTLQRQRQFTDFGSCFLQRSPRLFPCCLRRRYA